MSAKRWHNNMSGGYFLYLLVFLTLGIFLIKYLQKCQEEKNTSVKTEHRGTIPQNEEKAELKKLPEQKAIPTEAFEIFQYAMTHHGDTKPDYRGNTVFSNREKNLPLEENGIRLSYKEYDIHPWIKGQNRGPERVVISSKGVGYYTNDHYKTFIKIE